MSVETFFDYFITETESQPIYCSMSGRIYESKSNLIIYNIPPILDNDFFGFKIEFKEFNYESVYVPEREVCCRRCISKVYHILLTIKTDIIPVINDNGFLKHIFADVLTSQQIRKFHLKCQYNVNDDVLSHHISSPQIRELIPWEILPVGNGYVFDLINFILIETHEVTTLPFLRKGMLIETNDVNRLIKSHFAHMDTFGTLVIAPAEMRNLAWSWRIDRMNIREFDACRTIMRSYKRIIIHECHVRFIDAISLFKCTEIWIINSLPLTYYFSKTETPRTLTVSTIALIVNIWLNISNPEKCTFRNDLIRYCLLNFNEVYTRIEYLPEEIGQLTVKANALERHIHQVLVTNYKNWLAKLTCDPQNIYSWSCSDLNQKIEALIFNSVMTMILSIADDPDTFLNNKSKRTTQDIMSLQTNELECPICYDTSANAFVKTLCHHILCLDCTLSVISRANKCPICREILTNNRLSILKSPDQEPSAIMETFANIEPNTVILTDLDVSNYIKDNPAYQHVICLNVNHNTVFKDIYLLNNVNKILIIRPQGLENISRAGRSINKIIGFARLLCSQVEVCVFNVNFSSTIVVS